jgi:hypothetical protein
LRAPSSSCVRSACTSSTPESPAARRPRSADPASSR